MMTAMGAGEGGKDRRREGVLADWLSAQTYHVALYIALALPVGATVYGLLGGGAVAGLVSLPVLVGVPLLLGTLWLVGGLGEMQRFLAGLLGVRFPAPVLPPAYSGIVPWLRATLSDPATYRTLLFHVVQFPLATLCWVVLLLLGTAMVAGLSAPLWIADPAAAPTLKWKDSVLQPSQWGMAGLMLVGLGALLVTGGVLNLMGRMWVRLAAALLGRDIAAETAKREVVALRQAAGRVALGDDLGATLADLTAQARSASTARSVAVVAPDGNVLACSGPDDLCGPLDAVPLSGQANVRVASDGGVWAVLPVNVPTAGHSHLSAATLRAEYPAGQRPSPDELAFLASIADHAGTALHAAHLIERAGARAGEQERARLARELHDSVAQALYGISLGAKTARATLEKDPAKTKASLDYTIRLAEGGVAEMKALLFSLRPDALEEGGLIAALTQHAHALEARHGLTVHSELLTEPPLTPEVQAAVYRVAQEALHNVVKHARAQTVWLSLKETGNRWQLTVRDDGRGFDASALGRGTLGQRSMRERATGIQAQLQVESTPGEGTHVTLTLTESASIQTPAQAQEVVA